MKIQFGNVGEWKCIKNPVAFATKTDWKSILAKFCTQKNLSRKPFLLSIAV